MTDMTAEQAMKNLLRKLWKARHVHPTAHEISLMIDLAHIAGQALSQRVPDGWLVMRGKYGIIVQGPEGMITEQVRSSKQNLCFHDPVIYQFLESVLTTAPAPTEHVARVGTMEVTMDDECRVSRAVLRDAADVLRDYTDKPREAAPAPADSELARLRERERNLLSQILDVANVAGDGVPDAIDNDGQPYQSASLAEIIKQAASLRGGSDE